MLTIIEIIPYHELNMLYCPYSCVEISRVNMGVVITEIAFCKNEHTKNHNEALTCTGNDLYLPNNLFVLFALL